MTLAEIGVSKSVSFIIALPPAAGHTTRVEETFERDKCRDDTMSVGPDSLAQGYHISVSLNNSPEEKTADKL